MVRYVAEAVQQVLEGVLEVTPRACAGILIQYLIFNFDSISFLGFHTSGEEMPFTMSCVASYMRSWHSFAVHCRCNALIQLVCINMCDMTHLFPQTNICTNTCTYAYAYTYAYA